MRSVNFYRWRVRRAMLLLVGVACAAPLAAQDDLALLEQTAFKEAARRVADSVVQIRTIGGLDQREGVVLNSGPTSGMIIDPDGWIVSSAYNFADQPSSILVHLPGGKTAAARLTATDHSRMIVLLKVEHDGPLPVPALAEDEPRVGQWTVAVGKALSQTQPNLSTGIVSGLGRMHGRVIQTDAKISAVNYGGPLVDIHGRVLGILVPMSPEGETVVAGAEWYDSGIGFAVPIGSILERLGEMQAGRDQWPGKLGVALKPGPAYSTPAEVASVEPNSPAAEAGIQKGDVITAAGETAVASQRDLFFQLKPRYAGETVAIALRRGDETLAREATLIDKLRPYVAGFLGVLPERIPADDEDDPGGLLVRHVYPESPAARSGVVAGSRISRIGDSAVRSRDDAVTAMQAVAAGSEVELEIVQDSESQTVTIEAAALPEEAPAEIPIARPPSGDAPDVEVEVGATSIMLPDLTRQCPAYVPRNYRPDVPHAVFVWLSGGRGEANPTDAWSELCDRYSLILLAPAPEESNWRSEDLEYLERLIREVTARYAVDPHRIVVGGAEGGATAAFVLADRLREQVHGVAAVSGAPPRQLRLASDPVQRLAIWCAYDDQGRAGQQITRAVETLREAALPVSVVELPEGSSGLDANARAMLAQWIDTLDRL